MNSMNYTPEEYIILPGKIHNNYEYPDLLVPIEKTHFSENQNQTHNSLSNEDSLMLTIRQYADFLSLLKSGNAYYGNGRMLTQQAIDSLLDEILTVRSPLRAEHLDAKFTKLGNKLNITYHRINPDSTIQEVREPLEECLMSDKLPGIDIDNWLNNATSQGLPQIKTLEGSLYYWHPINNTVARVVADSVRANLSCDVGSSYSDPALGVRAAKIKR